MQCDRFAGRVPVNCLGLRGLPVNSLLGLARELPNGVGGAGATCKAGGCQMQGDRAGGRAGGSGGGRSGRAGRAGRELNN